MWYISLQWYLVHRTFCRTIFQSTTHAQIENLPSLHHGQQCISNMALIRVLAWGGTGGPCAPPPPSFLPQIVKTCTHKSTIYIHFPNPCYFLLLPKVMHKIRQNVSNVWTRLDAFRHPDASFSSYWIQSVRLVIVSNSLFFGTLVMTTTGSGFCLEPFPNATFLWSLCLPLLGNSNRLKWSRNYYDVSAARWNIFWFQLRYRNQSNGSSVPQTLKYKELPKIFVPA